MANGYDVFIKLSMTNAVSPVLAIIGKEMLGLETSAHRLEQAFSTVGARLKLIVGGAAAMFGGYEIGKGG